MTVMGFVPIDGIWNACVHNEKGERTYIEIDRIKGTPKQGDEINENFEIVQEVSLNVHRL